MSIYVAKTYDFCQKPQPGEIDLDQVDLWSDAIARLIIERRKAIGLNQEDVADKLGISRQTVSSFENGKARNIGFIVMLKMCLLLNVDIFNEAPAEYNDWRYEELREKLHDLCYGFG